MRLPALPQQWFDENRERYGANTESVSITPQGRCEHYFLRHTGTRIRCRGCYTTLIDGGKLTVENGKIVG